MSQVRPPLLVFEDLHWVDAETQALLDALLQVDRETVYRYIRSGKLDASRLGRSYRIPRRNIELLLLSTRTRPHINLREYTDEQIRQFEEADALDGEALEIARRFDRATGGHFFQDRGPEDRLI